ncbi:conserved hypothetical protein [Candida dubliniensis CD36]|uniref:Uncharacterized protein n=1 Tax=Candida dubliniensis (strain CD36 / ATCC MYA-646 / CBS 7987 / NCPF 3949 / NRRL Y-17841) TaxID=573826 RepID=B9WET3_CANDC|nr:conserved hypothetical protein [Candida dubliniensis CD36]CAX43195.1 conserved hypothetical protein [Candida dubliniensis CD36]
MSLNTSTSRSTITTSKRNPSSPSPPLPPSSVLDLINHHPELRLPQPQPQPIITSPPRMMTPDEFSLGSWHNIDIRVPESILSSDGEELDLDGNLPHNICDALVLESEEEEEEEEQEEQEESPQQEDKDKLIMPTMTMQSQYKPKITILSNNDVNSFVIQCLEGIADIQYSNLDTALTKRNPNTTTATTRSTNTDMVLMVNDDHCEIDGQIWEDNNNNNNKLSSNCYSYSCYYHDPLGVIFIDNWSLLFGFSIGLGLGMGIAFGMVSIVEKLLPSVSATTTTTITTPEVITSNTTDLSKEMNYLTIFSKKIVEYIKGGWVIVIKFFS